MIPSALTSVALSQQDAAFYEQNGYVLIEDALAPNLLAELKAAANAQQADRARRRRPTQSDDTGRLSEHCSWHQSRLYQPLGHRK